MTHLNRFLALWVFLVANGVCSAQVKLAAPNPVGDWSGTLEAGPQKLRLVLHITASDSGLRATMDSIDQGAKGLKFATAVLNGRELKLGMPRLRARFEGTISADGKSIDGTWTQGMGFPLKFVRGAKTVELKRPQHPKAPFPYRVEEVRYAHAPGRTVEASFTTDVADAGTDVVTLAGTLTIPKGAGPFPAAVLISGSGPQDRDEALMGHKPFLVIADHLTRQGIAVLRYDDRGTAKSTGSFQVATSQDFADDAEAGYRYLATRKEIDAKKIGFVGHSEGGLIAPIVAARTPGIAYIVLLAGPGVPGDEIIALQSQLMAKAAGADAKSLATTEKANAAIFAAVRAESDVAKLRPKVAKILRDSFAALDDAERATIGDIDEAVAARVARVTSPWFLHFLTFDPRPTLQKVRCPVLAMNGGLDLQVDADQNLLTIEKALTEGACKDVVTARFPKLNHLFQTATTGAVSEYSKIEETFAPVALTTISEFIQKRFAK